MLLLYSTGTLLFIHAGGLLIILAFAVARERAKSFLSMVQGLLQLFNFLLCISVLKGSQLW